MQSEKVTLMKRLMVEAILEQQGRCFIHVIPSSGDQPSVLPRQYLDKDACTLALNLYTQNPALSDWGVSVITQFSGHPFKCEVPWSAVVQVFDPEQQGAVLAWLFPIQESKTAQSEEDYTSSDRGTPAVEDTDEQDATHSLSGVSENSAPSKPRQGSHLKVIK